MKSGLLFGLLLVSATAFAQPQAIGFASQDSLLRIYYTPKARWADSIVQIIRQQATGHCSAEVYRQIKALQQKGQAAGQPPAPYPATHSAIFWEEVPLKKRRKK